MKTMNLKQWMIILLSFTILSTSCEDDDKITGAYLDGAFISNEGGFGAGNGSISFYNYDKDTVYNNIFSTVNNRVLGDVVQSITLKNNLAYIVVNASNKIEIAYANTFKEKGVITDVVNPRYFVALNNSKGYASQWGENGAIKVIDLKGLAVTKTVTVGAGAERMLITDNMLYVANSGGYANNNTISVIDTDTDEVVKTITLDGDSPRDLVEDANGDIWVLCAGFVDWYSTPMTQTPSKLIRITTNNNEVAESITISDSFHPTCLEVSKNGNNIFYGGGYGVQGIFKMSITDNTVPSTALIDKSFYGFNINPETGVIYAMEAPSFSASGTLYRYETNGSKLGEYEAGIGPNGAGFKKK